MSEILQDAPNPSPSGRRPIGVAKPKAGKQLCLIDGTDDKVGYWLTPPEDWKKLEEEFGPLFDPCPFPRPGGWNGLVEDWGDGSKVAYANPPYEGPDTGFSKWARKSVEQYQKGRKVILIYPVLSWLDILLKAKPEIRPLGTREWVRPDGKRRKSPSPLVYFILDPTKESCPHCNGTGKVQKGRGGP